jgi:hypothetical protein
MPGSSTLSAGRTDPRSVSVVIGFSLTTREAVDERYAERALHLDTLLRTAESAPARKGRVWLSVVESPLTDTELPRKPVASELAYIWRRD